MKSKKFVHSAILLLAAAFTQITYSQTVEIDPVSSIPGTHTSMFATEWNTDGNPESWVANSNYVLAAGTPTGGLLTGTQSATNDPTLTRSGLSFFSSPDTIVEYRITKDIADTSRIDLFWADDSGGFAGNRLVGVTQPFFPTDGLPHTVRITFSGQMFGKLSAFRLDPSADVVGQNKTSSTDYFRVYTTNAASSPLIWDPAMTAGVAPGGSGTWDTSTTSFWNGSTQVAWPAVSSGVDEAVFGGTAGIVTLPSTITAAYVNFTSTGYTLAGNGPLTLDGTAIVRNSAGTHVTTVDVPIAGSVTNTFSTGSFLFSKAGIQTGTTRLFNVTTGITVDNAFGPGPGKVIFGSGGNSLISSLGSGTERVLNNDVEIRANRFVVDSNLLGTALPLLPLTLGGNVLLATVAPGDIFLRQNLKINGVVSGTGPNAALYFAGNAGVLTLNNAANTFTNNIRWDNATIVEAVADGSLGDAANSLRFNLGAGTLRMLAAFDSARPIVIANNVAGAAGAGPTTARIDTNGFDSTWTGTISAPVFVAPATNQQNTHFVKTGAGTLTLDSGGVTPNNLRLGGIRVDGGALKIASGAITSGSSTANGVAGDCLLEINGGSLLTGNFSVGKSAGTATFTLNSGGTYTNGAEFLVAFNLGDGIVNINGGLADLNQFSMVDKTGLTSTMNLNGGEVRLNFFNARANPVDNTAVAIINFNGSTVRAKSTQTDFIETNTNTAITANVQAGGAIFDTTNGATTSNITIKQPLIHDADLGVTLDGGLTKNGLGTLTLAPVAGPNTYTGPTTVNLGVLEVSGTSIDDAGKLNIAGGKVLIPAATNENVNTLFYNGVPQPAGIYGSTASGAANSNDTFFDIAGSGTLTVATTGASGGYAAFAAGLSPGGAGDDADSDGLDNAVEYVVGGDPRVSSQVGRPTSSVAAGVITFSFNRVDSSETPDVTTIVQVSTDLVDWTTLPSYTVGADTASSTAGVVVTENGAAADTIVVTIPNTGSTTKFARLSVRVAP